MERDGPAGGPASPRVRLLPALLGADRSRGCGATGLHASPSSTTDRLDPFAALAAGDLDGELRELPPDARVEPAHPHPDRLLDDESALAANTRKVYTQRWRIFLLWCKARGVGALPAHPDVLRVHLLDLARGQKAISTIEATHNAIVAAHRRAGVPSPATERVREVRRALRRALDHGQRRQIRLDTLRALMGACAGDLLAVRDRAMLLVTYWGRLRRSETARLDCPLERQGDRYLLRLGPEPQNVRVLAPHAEPDLCPVRALEAWIAERGQSARPPLTATTGPLFVGVHRGQWRPLFKGQPLFLGKRIHGSEVDRALKRRLQKAGMNPASRSAHDLRAEIPKKHGHG